MMEAASISETSANFYVTSRRNIPEDAISQILTAASMKMAVFWDVAPYSLVKFTDVSQVHAVSIIIPQDSDLYTDRRENLKRY
jgi:hypothetical protein